jgi:o-succinylbenzoate synthase
MYKASVEKYVLDFKRPSGTSRGVLTQKDSWFIRIWETKNPAIVGIGEASIIQNLSPEWNENYEDFLEVVVKNINEYVNGGCEALLAYPSIYFAIETALLDLKNGGVGVIFPSDFVTNQAPISINGLIWMGSKDFMLDQINQKIGEGYSCLKLKIGAIDFSSELDLLAFIRSKFSKDQLELRVDANGAFSPKNALNQLNELAQFDLHSIEQPIKQGQLTEMADLCAKTPFPIALDEELIGVVSKKEKEALLTNVKPQYIILKPSLIGGFRGSDEWIELADALNIDWWITSALESNIGLNAIAQYTFTKNNPMPQGLGTGQLYTNNIPSGLTILEGKLFLGSNRNSL